MGEWVPVNQNHAIEVMAAVITLHEPLPKLIQRKVFKATEDIAFELGLRSRHILAGEQVVSPGVMIKLEIPQREDAPPGYLFNSMTADPESGERPSHPNEQIEIRGNAIIYRTWQYISWAWNFERMQKLMAPLLTMSRDAVPIQRLRIEYLDRFIYSDNAEIADVGRLLRANCPMLTPQAYSQTGHWHSHSGIVVKDAGNVQRVRLVNVDTAEVDEKGELFRCINVMTALEDRRKLDLDDGGHDIVQSAFNEMHDELKLTLGQIINDDLAKKIYLNG